MSEKTSLISSQAQIQEQISKDTPVISDNMEKLLDEVFPYYFANDDLSNCPMEKNSFSILEDIAFLKIEDCTIENAEDVSEYLNDKVQKFLAAAYSIGATVCYGIVGREGKTSVILGINPLNYSGADAIKKITQGLLPGIKLSKFKLKPQEMTRLSIIGGIPTNALNEQKQHFDYAPLIRSLNGHDYTLLTMAKPILPQQIQDKINNLIQIKDNCISVSKRNVSLQESIAKTQGTTTGETTTQGTSVAVYGGFMLPGGGGGASVGQNSSHAENISKSISDTITGGKSLSMEIQNGFALEIISLAENAIERLKTGKTTGLWQTVVSYSADSDLSMQLLHGCLYSEIAKPNPKLLPPRIMSLLLEPTNENKQALIIPQNFFNQKDTGISRLCSITNTGELSLLCSLPDRCVPGYELKTGKYYPITTGAINNEEINAVNLGAVCDCETELNNIEFNLSLGNLNKHTFVCGITGSGKTNTVKHILSEANKPFLVIECAKKEYRGMSFVNKDREFVVYTLGKPEINCISFNPFYILPGISPQMHIDYLKDLFNASFSFYGPMPYIVEKCLHNVYLKRGWNLSMGYHPSLVKPSTVHRFDIDYVKEQYAKEEHKFLFPTMSDLKAEVESYIKENMDYKGEISDNIKTAILARLESLCVGVKGFMFDTNEIPRFSELLNNNVVFELEGLADDSDKAFAVGILIVYLSEYRMFEKEATAPSKELKHLLVIEEAHRLLKNISTERISEDMGNPKGKAIEHFTNIIAEMRSYGQGVIISEQIPNKIAPDVIKNSSNKIIHRIVSKDDQELIANMIGINDADAIFLGDQKTGRALCHVEGMRLPMSVKIPIVKNNIIKDSDLRHKEMGKQDFLVLVSLMKPHLTNSLESEIIKLLNTIFTFNVETIKKSIEIINAAAIMELRKTAPYLLRIDEHPKAIAQVLSECLIKLLLTGIYRVQEIPQNTFMNLMEALAHSYTEPVTKLVEIFKLIDNGNELAVNTVTELSVNFIELHPGEINLGELIKSYFICVDNIWVSKITAKIQSRLGIGNDA